MTGTEETTVAIVGAGFSGLGMARQLQLAGIDDFVLLERADEVGGTWRDNRYPGCACDVRSHLYSWSFALNPDWSSRYARHDEIQDYIVDRVRAWGLRPHLRLGAQLRSAVWDEARHRWVLTCADGRSFDAAFQVAALGALKDPRVPDLPGSDSFAGPTLHSARWDPGVDLRGKRVGIVGTGASAVQIVPELAGVASLTVFQRSAPWVFPRLDWAIPPWRRTLYRKIPGLARLVRALEYLSYEVRHPAIFGPRPFARRPLEAFARWWARRRIRDPATAAALLPDYQLGCKRALVSDGWYEAFDRDDVTLVTEPIERVLPDGIRAGGDHALDVLIWCTGFAVDEPLGDVEIRGLGGRSLAQQWAGRPAAHLGITVPGFPNTFLLLGPNTALGHSSVLLMIEPQIRYALQAITWVLADPDRAFVDVEQAACDAFVAEVDARHRPLTWGSGCRSWYRNQDGANWTLWPGTTAGYRWRVRRFDPRLHRSRPPVAPQAAATGHASPT